jgi:hypothetical protein
MARITIDIIRALRLTADQLERSTTYQWGHMGACNCGFLAQQVTKLTKKEIHSIALQGHGDWNEQLNDYCPTSGLPFDGIITALLSHGFDIDDLRHLENLSDPAVLRFARRVFSRNSKPDAVTYLRHWASLLEVSLLERVTVVIDAFEEV